MSWGVHPKISCQFGLPLLTGAASVCHCAKHCPSPAVLLLLLLGVLTQYQVYISTIEAKKYPVLGLQWHPEKNSFEWTRHKQIPHGYWSSEVTHQVGAGGGRVHVCV